LEGKDTPSLPEKKLFGKLKFDYYSSGMPVTITLTADTNPAGKKLPEF
jgi:hypothetical protein